MRDYTGEMYAVNHELARRHFEITVKGHMKARWQMDIRCGHNREKNSSGKTISVSFLRMFGDLKLSRV